MSERIPRFLYASYFYFQFQLRTANSITQLPAGLVLLTYYMLLSHSVFLVFIRKYLDTVFQLSLQLGFNPRPHTEHPHIDAPVLVAK
jgi:hypothetical protein